MPNLIMETLSQSATKNTSKLGTSEGYRRLIESRLQRIGFLIKSKRISIILHWAFIHEKVLEHIWIR